MEEKVLRFDNVSTYLKIADGRAEKEDFFGALGFLLSAKSLAPENLKVTVALADLYSDMGLLELSNRFWFEYLDKAPKENYAMAYEELAINYFYLDNFWASGYYFHKKLEIDGYVSKEGLSQEIIDFFSGEEQRKGAYRIAYPFDRADYSYQLKKAKHAIALGGFEEGDKILSSIPEECLDENTAGDLAVCKFMSDKLDEAEDVCRASLERHGANVTAFCNLSTVYDMKEDFDNSDYYYRKALEIRKGEQGEAYKIATCAIEREDHQTVLDCLNTILIDRPYELAMRFFYGLAFVNIGNFQLGYEQLKIAYSLDDKDVAVKFHLDYVKDIIDGEGDYLNLLPFKYVKDIPEQVAKNWKKKLRALTKNPEKFSSAMKKIEWQKILEWGLTCNDLDIMRDCAYVLSSNFTPYSKALVMRTLLNPEGREELKRILVYVAILSGLKERFGVVAGSYYLKVKPRKLVCEKDKVFGGLYFSAYALCMSKMVFFDIDGMDKIGKVCDAVYKKFRSIITEAEVSNEEIAALILSECGYKNYSDDDRVVRLFTITKEKLSMLKKSFKGVKND